MVQLSFRNPCLRLFSSTASNSNRLESCSLLQAKRGPVIKRGELTTRSAELPCSFLLGVAQKSRFEDAGGTTKRASPDLHPFAEPAQKPQG